MNTKERIIKIYETDLQHPSYGYIGKKVGISKAYAFQVITQYKQNIKKILKEKKGLTNV